MASIYERGRLTEKAIKDPYIDYAIKGLQSLGIMSAGQALGNWEVQVIKTKDWATHEDKISAVHLFPWGTEVESDRVDKAWFAVNIDYNGDTHFYCKRDEKNGYRHVTLASKSGSIDKNTYPKKWDSVHLYNTNGNNVGAGFRLGPSGEVISLEFHEGNNWFNARADSQGTDELDKTIESFGQALGLQTHEMPARTAFNPGRLVNSILDQAQPFNVPQIIASARV